MRYFKQHSVSSAALLHTEVYTFIIFLSKRICILQVIRKNLLHLKQLRKYSELRKRPLNSSCEILFHVDFLKVCL